jgi:hypothetical protein
MSFPIATGPRQRSHSQVRVLQDSRSYFTLSDLGLPQPGRPGPRIYIPQEDNDPGITLGTGFPFCHLLLLAGLRWRYSAREADQENTVSIVKKACLLVRYLTNDVIYCLVLYALRNNRLFTKNMSPWQRIYRAVA